MNTDENKGDLDIPEFLKRSPVKAAEPVKSEVVMSEAVETEAPARKPRKAVAKANGAAKVKAAPKAAKAVKAAPKAKAKAAKVTKTPLDEYGYREGSLKSQAAAMYGSKKGATLEEVKAKLKSVQLNLLTDLEAKGFKVSKVKEDGDGKRQVTRYFLRAK